MNALIYRNGELEIELHEPWGDHSGMIPPPTITFWSEQYGDYVFAYAGRVEVSQTHQAENGEK